MAKNKDIQHLQALEVAHRSAAAPSIPLKYITPFKYTDQTANGLTRCIIDWLRFNGFQSERINTQGRMVDKTKVVKDVLGCRRSIGSVEWQKGSGTKGSADISATINGRSVKIEVKIGKDVQSRDQKAYQQSVEQAGGIYFIANDFSSFYLWFNDKFGGTGDGI
jgi:hypothetical protein